MVVLGVSTLLWELGSPLALVGSSAVRTSYLLASVGFFIGMRVTMHTATGFLSWVPVCLCLADWRWLTATTRDLRSRLSRRVIMGRARAEHMYRNRPS
jgi:hypothetical protein